MSEITTYTGKLFDPTNPNIDGIDIVDIAHALSLLCRGNGHVKHFYSVGQHSISCYREAKARNYSKKVQLACLFHDGSEAYLSDITRPVKPKLPEYLIIEDKLQNIIWQKFIKEPLSEKDLKQVFEKYSKQVHLERMKDCEFDYLIYFENGEPDSYRYCITEEMCHLTYHRFTEADYEAFHF